jgi:hypothetical protein
VEIAAARGGQAELGAEAGVFGVLGLAVGTCHHLHRLATVLLEFGEQRVFLGGGELVAPRVGDHGHAAGAGDPAHRVAQCGPAVRHEAGLAFGQVLAEHLGDVLAHAAVHQMAREV